MPVGESGELCICGPQVMKGYWNKPEETADALRRHDDGRIWFHTGDVATMDEEGYTSIVQRKKDMIIVDGFNVYPSEVEGVLYTHPAVRMVAVIGVPDAYHGEVVKACVVPRDPNVSLDDLKAHCKANLAAYKVPVHIELRESLPQSAVGKVLYRVLRDELQRASAKAEATKPRTRNEGSRRLSFVTSCSSWLSFFSASPCGHFPSSIFAIASRCTSSGPSASRSVRECAQARARKKSSLTPPPPCA